MSKPAASGQGRRVEHVTPSGEAEKLYQLKQNRPYPIGPAGIQVPPSTAWFRKTVDPDVLKRIVAKAREAWAARELPVSAHSGAAAILRAELLKLFPVPDMEVLDRYGHANHVNEVVISFAIADDAQRSHWMKLAKPIMLPKGLGSLQARLGGRVDISAKPAPASIEPYLRKVIEVRRARSFEAAMLFPQRFRTDHGRMPKWGEIEREYPEIGRWLSEQRKAMSNA